MIACRVRRLRRDGREPAVAGGRRRRGGERDRERGGQRPGTGGARRGHSMEVAETKRAAAAGRRGRRSRSTSTACASGRAPDFVRRGDELVFSRELAQRGAARLLALDVALPRRRRHLPARTTVSTSSTRSDGRRIVRTGLPILSERADRGGGALTGRRDDDETDDTPKAIAAALDLERRNFLILLVAGALALAAAMGLADMAGYSRLVDAVQDVVPTWFAVCFGGQVVAYLGYVLAVRDIARVDGGPLLSLPPLDADGRRRVRRLRRHARGRRLLGRLLDVPALGAPPPRGGRARARARRARVRRARARRR